MAIALAVVSTMLFFSVAVNSILVIAFKTAMDVEKKLRKEIEDLEEAR